MTSTHSTKSRPTVARVLAAASFVLAILLGTGCGQSGPLFLPAEEPAARAESGAVEEPGDGQTEQADTDETKEGTKDRDEMF